ncbi:MAG: hypothetical protein AAF205_10660 [Pseudomonadota bacterium]
MKSWIGTTATTRHPAARASGPACPPPAPDNLLEQRRFERLADGALHGSQVALDALLDLSGEWLARHGEASATQEIPAILRRLHEKLGSYDPRYSYTDWALDIADYHLRQCDHPARPVTADQTHTPATD